MVTGTAQDSLEATIQASGRVAAQDISPVPETSAASGREAETVMGKGIKPPMVPELVREMAGNFMGRRGKYANQR